MEEKLSDDERELARDCWNAIRLLEDNEIPEWLAATASRLPPHELPNS